MRYAVIGTGWIAGSYIEGAAIAGNWELAAVCSRRRETGLAFGQKYGVETVFTSVEELEKDFVYNDFCGNNLSKYLIKESRKEGKILAFLKPCDTYSFNQLLKEHRILRDNVYVVGVPCEGKTDGETLKAKGVKGILGIRTEGDSFAVDTLYGEKTLAKADALPERCLSCKSKKHMVYDELLGLIQSL